MSKYNLDKAIILYKSVGSRNADFLFPWLYQIYDRTFLPSIDIKYKENLSSDKTKLTIFDVLVDDLADNAKIRNKQLLEKAVKIPFNGSKKYNHPYLQVTRQVWVDCINSIKKYPRYDEFKDIFFFDLEQVMNSMKYSYLVNTTDISSYTEDETYLNHGVMVILHCDMDLMCSPNFEYEELKKLRPILHWVQDIAHIGNMLNTYPKEIVEVDFSSPIISMGLREGLIDKSMLIKNSEYTMTSLQPLISSFKNRMRVNLRKIKAHTEDITSIDMNNFYERLKNVCEEFLKREQYWKTSEGEEEIDNLVISEILDNSSRWVRF